MGFSLYKGISIKDRLNSYNLQIYCFKYFPQIVFPTTIKSNRSDSLCGQSSEYWSMNNT
jgi:hypothetical protein